MEYGLLGFLVGLKVIGAFIHHVQFFSSPFKFIFSLEGSWEAALILSTVFALFVFWQRQKDADEMPAVTKVKMYPHQLMPKLVLWAAIWGFLGAKVFNYLENFQRYNSSSLADFLSYSGLTFLGGLTFGAFSFLYIGYKAGMKLIDLADIGSPGMLVAYFVGRIGCHLSGDGDWGIINNHVKPFTWLPDWLWSYQYPHNILNYGTYIPGCTGYHCFILPAGVYPTSLYETLIVMTGFLVLWFNRHSINRSGLMFCFYLLIVGGERFFIEFLRLNYKYSIFGFQLSQAQLISLLFLLMAGILSVYVIRERPAGQRSPGSFL